MVECFKINFSDIDDRLDCFFYKPEFLRLERMIGKITDKKLNDYILSISSGATPNVKEGDKYYTTSEEGIPFLRVQNITNEGLKLDNCKFINKNTHNSLLKRSQVKENDLVTKITGVGRMAVSSVAPPGFDGNINQHLVVIKTESVEVSNTLANFLNSDIGERLAFRRTTGGTRPALDYKALKSIPIVYKPQINKIMDQAYVEKNIKVGQAEEILDSINDFILEELKIQMPDDLRDRMSFHISSKELKNNRFDPYYYQLKFKSIDESLRNSNIKKLGEFITNIRYGASVKNTYVEKGIPFLRILNIKPNKIDLNNVVELPVNLEKDIGNAVVHENDLLISRSGTVGIVAVVPKEAEGFAFGSFMIKFSLSGINENYVSLWLNTQISKLLIEREKIGAIQKNITIPTIKNLKIPIPTPELQEKIADEVKSRMNKAEKLLEEANGIIITANKEVEKIILG